ncbi:YfhO family protein [Alicyclobacillus sp. ALC3]|uniref:YfhO family protein n=1 Tax=Alicyclobacillus sp. ALC3 TaxID=2796143 RepID=UPI0023797EEC|nr:YfhO family protein [Alicyclobacillus sp. ALC3]WDL98207.1 YfhO family protein [Alicyclobacillus sp. ALC3]
MTLKAVWRKRLTSHVSTVFMLAVATALAYPTWLSSEPMALDDLQQLNAPQRGLLAWFYQHGHLPLWNPFNFAGQPFLAAGQSGPFYLPNVVFLLLPLPTAMKVSYLFHELLGSIGMYALLWRVTKHKLASFAGALAFITCGFLLGHEIHTQMFDAFTWIPLCLLFLQRILDRPTRLNIGLFGVFFAMEIYAGHPQVTFYLCLMIALYAIYYSVYHAVRAKAWRVGLRHLLYPILGVMLGLGLSALQWAPTLDLVNYSDRVGVNSSFLLLGTLPISGLIQFLSPFPTGGGYTGIAFSAPAYLKLFHVGVYWEYFPYVGVISLTLATAVPFSEFRRIPSTVFLFLSAVFFTALAEGYHTFLKYILTDVPGFNFFRVPARYTGLADILICVLAAIGIVQLWRGNKRLRTITGFVALGYAAILTAVRLFGPLRLAPAPAYWVVLGVLVGIAVLCLSVPWQNLRAVRNPKVVAGTLAVLMVADAMMQGVSMSTLVLHRLSGYTYESPAAVYLQKRLLGSPNNPYPFERFAALDQSSLSQDRVLTDRIPALNGEDSLVPQWYTSTANLTWDDTTMLAQPLSVFNWLDVKYVTTAPGDAVLPMVSYAPESWSDTIAKLPSGPSSLAISVSSPWTSVNVPIFSVTLESGTQALSQTVSGSANGTYVVAIPAGWPRNTPTKVRIKDENRAQSITINSLQVNGFTVQAAPVKINQTLAPPAWKVVYETPHVWVWKNPNPLRAAWVTPDSRAPGLASKDRTKLVQWSPNQQVWDTSGATGGWFVLSQMYDPNWTATVNGRPAQVAMIGGFLTGVRVPAGNHQITLHYRPQALVYGMWLTLIAAVVLAVLLLFGRIRGFSKRRASR